MQTEQDHLIVEAMIRYGGSFVNSLALCFTHADINNFNKLKNAFPEYWKQYKDLAKKDNE